MGQTITCDLCSAEEAAFMLTSLTDGSTSAVGADCMPAYITGLAQSAGLVAIPVDAVPVEMGGTLVLESTVVEDTTGRERVVRGKRGGRKPASESIPVDEETDEPTDEPVAVETVETGVTP